MSPEVILSPQQIALAAFIEKNPKLGWKTAIEQDFLQAWQQVMQM